MQTESGNSSNGLLLPTETSKLNRCILGEVFWQEDTSRRNNQCRLSVTRTESRDPKNVIHESLEIKSSLYGVLTSKGTSRSWWRVDEGAGVKCWTVWRADEMQVHERGRHSVRVGKVLDQPGPACRDRGDGQDAPNTKGRGEKKQDNNRKTDRTSTV